MITVQENKVQSAEKKKMSLNTLPQANDFKKILKMVKAFENKKYHTHESLQKFIEVHDREISYYLHAAKTFKFIEVSATQDGIPHYSLTEQTKKVLETRKPSQVLYFIRKIMRNDICRYIVDNYLEKGYFLTHAEISGYIRRTHPSLDLSDITIERRISTVNSWSKWVVTHMKYIY